MIKTYFSFSLKDTAVSVLLLAVTTLICIFIRNFDSGDIYVSMLFLLCVALTARLTRGYVYGIVSSVISVFIINYLFTYPYFKFNMTMTGYPIAVASMLIVSVIVSAMTTQIKQQEKLKADAAKEKMRGNLLRGISHDLRTPLTSVLGASNVLMENEQTLSEEEKFELYKEINEDAGWLLRMVENVLSVTKLQSEVGSIKKSLEVAEEIISHCIIKVKKYYPDANIEASVPEDMLFVPMDCTLIEQVIINIIENAVIHGKTTTKVSISAEKEKGFAKFVITDDGEGFKKEIIEKIKDGKFIYPSENDSSKSMGIGLSVCMSIIKAHGGKMEMKNLKNGASVSFYIPLDEDESI